MSFVNLNGKLLNESKAGISIHNRSFRYGDGSFETLRMVEGWLPLWPYHWQRLQQALHLLQFDTPSFLTAAFLQERIKEVVEKNGHQQSARIRLTLFRGNGGLYDPENHFPNYLIQSWPLSDAVPLLNTNGLVIGTYTGGFKAADAFANLKSNNYLLYVMAALHAKQQRWNEALILNHRNSIADATIANLFVVQDKTLVTPPLTDGPVAGTFRRYLLEKVPALGYTVLEQSLQPKEVLMAQEVFVTNAVYGIKWVKSFEGKEYGNRYTTLLYQDLVKPLFGGEVAL
jgi:branched-chain amino acid aminotransferase